MKEECTGILTDPAVAWTEEVLRFSDTDAMGHVNNRIAAVLTEGGRMALITAPGLAMDGQLFILAQQTFDYRAELHFPGQPRVATWLQDVGRSSFTLGQAVLTEGGTLAVLASASAVQISDKTRRAVPMLPSQKEWLEQYRPASLSSSSKERQ